MINLLLGTIENGQWHVGLGTDGLGQGLMIGAYCLAALFCSACVAKPPGRPREEQKFWFNFTIFMLVLAVAKIVDLPNWLTLTGRQLAENAGWYSKRRVWQALVIFLIALCGLILAGAIWRQRNQKLQHKFVLGTGMLLLALILVRIVSFHYMDRVIGRPIMGELRVGYFLEGCGVMCVAVAAFRTRFGLARKPLVEFHYE